MIKNCENLMELQHIHTVQVLLEYVEAKCLLERKLYQLNCITMKYRS